MRSPKSRILQLKQEIAELDQKLVNSCIMKQEVSLPLQPSNKKHNERDEILKKLNSLRVSTFGKGETLNSQLFDLQTKIKQVSFKKQSEILSSKKNREKISEKIVSHNTSLKNFYEEYQSLSSSITKRQKLKEDLSLAKAKAYEDSLLPLEKEAESLCREKESLLNEQIRLQEEVVITENIYNMCKEDMLSRYTQRAEYIGQREEVEVLLESFEIKYADDLEFLTEDDVKTNHLQNLKINEQLQNLENAIVNNNLLIESLQKKYQKIINELEGFLCLNNSIRSNSELKMMEQVIIEKSEEYDVDSLENVILDLNALENFDIDEEILKIQLEEVVKFENKLKFEFEYQEKELLERLSEDVTGQRVENEFSILGTLFDRVWSCKHSGIGAASVSSNLANCISMSLIFLFSSSTFLSADSIT